MCADNNGKIYVGGLFSVIGYAVEMYDGSAWATLGTLNLNAAPLSICVDKHNNVYAAGAFYNTPNANYYILKWGGSNWSQLGTFDAPSVNGGNINSIYVDTSDNLYVAGEFTNSNNKAFVGKWNGTTWGTVGGFDQPTNNGGCKIICADKYGNLYTGGTFYNANGHYYVAKYAASTLAIQFTDFSVMTQGNKVTSIWKTANEANMASMIVQRGINDISFIDIGTVNVIGSGANSYQFTDNNPANGINYYRLKSIDKSGAVTYSKVVYVQFTVNRLPLTVAPNPVRNVVTIQGSHIVSVQVVDNMGKIIKTQTLKDATNPTLSVGSLPVGVYHLRVQTTDGKVSEVAIVKK